MTDTSGGPMEDPTGGAPPPPPPGAAPPPPQPDPQAGGLPGTGPASAVIVRPKIFFLAFILLLFKVRLSVDGGEPTVIGWTDNVIPLPPGRHTLRCYLPYLFYRTMGDSSVEVEVPPNGSVRARWRTPWLVFLPGKWTVSAD